MGVTDVINNKPLFIFDSDQEIPALKEINRKGVSHGHVVL